MTEGLDQAISRVVEEAKERHPSSVTPITKSMQLVNNGKDGLRHPRGCDCRPCVGKRNRRSGLKKQRDARRLLKIPDPRFRSLGSNEEQWTGAVRAEVKSGKQVESMAARFLAAEKQADQNKTIGDPRPFVFVAMPVQWGQEGLLVFRATQMAQVVQALYESFLE